MRIPPLLDRIPDKRRVIVFVPLFVTALLLLIWIGEVGEPVGRRLAHGIIDVEMPWTPTGAAQVLKDLGDAGIAAARLSTLLDFLLLAVYPPALSLLCVIAVSLAAGYRLLAKVALWTAWSVLFAAPLDAIENVCMLRLLNGHFSSPWPQVGSLAAVLKFVLIGAVFAIVVVCTMVRLRNVGWWIGKGLVLLRLNVFTWLSLAIGVYFFGLSQAARELWEDLLGQWQVLPILVTLIAWTCWMAALLWAPWHAHAAFLADYRRRHGVEWPKVEDNRRADHVRVRRWMDATPAIGVVLAGAAVAFGAVTNGVAEAQKDGPMLALVLIAACVNGIASELRWRRLPDAERRARGRRLMRWQAALGVVLCAIAVGIANPARLSAHDYARVLMPAVLPTLFACAAASWIGHHVCDSLPKVIAALVLRSGLSLAVVLPALPDDVAAVPLLAVVVIVGVIGLEALYHVVRDRSAGARHRGHQVVDYMRRQQKSLHDMLSSPPSTRGGVRASMPVVLGTLLFALWPVQVGASLGSLAVAMLALAAWTLLCAVVFIITPTRLGFGAVPFALPLWLFLVSPLTDNHTLPDVKAPDPTLLPAAAQEPAVPPPRRPDLRIAEDFEAWMQSGERSSKPQTPVVLVSASGGGMRAAYWTATTLARLDDLTCGEFGRQTYAISGVSGGSVGAAVYVATVSHLRRPAPAAGACTPPAADAAGPAETLVRRFFEQDVMAPLLGSMLFPDAVQRFFPAIIPWGDRGSALERAMETAWSRASGGARHFAEPMTALYERDATRSLPLLVFNATNVADGRGVQASPVLLQETLAYPLMSNELRTQGLHLSTAAHNSARFPLVSPPGTVLDRDGAVALRIVDGGYFENSAAAGASSIYRTLRAHPSLAARPIAVLIVENDPELDEPSAVCGLEAEQLAAQWATTGKPPPVSRNPVPLPSQSPAPPGVVFELTSITSALLAARTARAPWHQQELATIACEGGNHLVRGFFYRNGVHDPLRHADRDDAAGRRPAPDPALSWALSRATRERMDRLMRSGVERALTGRFSVWSTWPHEVAVAGALPAP